MIVLLFVLGVAALVSGAELLVRGSARIAARFGISSLVIGLTVVAFGTSAPELAVGTAAAYNGAADIALGNVVGSNIMNVLIVLGLSAVVAPIIVARDVVRRQMPVMIGVSLLVMLLALDMVISRAEGALLFSGIILYTFILIRQSRRESLASRMAAPMLGTAPEEDTPEALAGKPPRLFRPLAEAVLGLLLLVLGAGWLVDAATDVAVALGVSELVIGLTVVAAGTSLPEVATSLVAALRGERDMAVGNVVGSNIFNLLSILGVAAMVAPGGIGVAPAALTFDLPVMIAVALVCLPIFFNGRVIHRWEGAVLVGFYIGYTTYLVLDASGHQALPQYRYAMTYFVLPLALLTLVASSLRHGVKGKAADSS